MKTEVISTVEQPEKGALRGAALIKKGELVAFPTETVYGLGADGLNGQAVNKIFEAKGRPNDNPLILHVAEKSAVRALWKETPPLAEILTDTFWPGPLTLIYNRSAAVPNEVTAGLDTVAVRMPDNPTALALIRASETPIAAPSANLSGRPSPTTAEHVLLDMEGRIPLLLNGGPCRFGVESTVLSLVDKPTILRPGAVTKEMLEAVIGPVALSGSILSPLLAGEKALSPGMKYKHYAPKAQVIVVSGEAAACAGRILELYDKMEAQGHICEIAATVQTIAYYQGKRCSLMGDRENPATLCANLFSLLREMDKRADVILSEGVEATGAGLAFMNRLLRAAGFCIERV